LRLELAWSLREHGPAENGGALNWEMLGPPPGITAPVDAGLVANPGLTNSAYVAGVHAQNATQVALRLAGQVQELYSKAADLEKQVKSLEKWKADALQEVRRLRIEHRDLKRLMTEHLGLPEPTKPQPETMKRTISEPLRVQAAWTDSFSATGSMQLPGKASSFGGLSEASVPASLPRSLTDLDMDLGANEGVKVERSACGQFECAVWRIAHLTKRLKECMGRNIVSSPFVAWQMEDVRLMVCPEGKDARAGRTRKQKNMYANKVSDGTLEAGLKLKVPDCTRSLTYHVKVGNESRGPFAHNFAEHSVSDFVQLGIDFLQKIEQDGSLTVTAEIQRPSDFVGSD